VIGLALLIAPFLVAFQQPRSGKSFRPMNAVSKPFDDARMKFDVRFYLVAILFIIFDLEVAFPVPWGRFAFREARLQTGFWSMMVFPCPSLQPSAFAYEMEKKGPRSEWD